MMSNKDPFGEWKPLEEEDYVPKGEDPDMEIILEEDKDEDIQDRD